VLQNVKAKIWTGFFSKYRHNVLQNVKAVLYLIDSVTCEMLTSS